MPPPHGSHVVSHVVGAVPLPDLRQQVVPASDTAPAAGSTTAAVKGSHVVGAEGGILNGDGFTLGDVTAGDVVQTPVHGVGVAAVVDGLPAVGVVAPRDPCVVCQRIRVRAQPLPVGAVPGPAPLHVAPGGQHEVLLLVTDNHLPGGKVAGGVQPVARTAPEQNLHSLCILLALSPLQCQVNDVVDEPGVAGGGVQAQDEVRAAMCIWRVEDTAVGVHLQEVDATLRVHSEVTTPVAAAAQRPERLLRRPPQPGLQLRLLRPQSPPLDAVVVAPLEVKMLEALTGAEHTLHRQVRDRLLQVVRVLRHQHRELTARYELLN
mmetsp:Transcript_24454/g.53407  ORF Transcript_24454/g.53407 Transcript_24454/m.53407 type:complete len:320 (-) Transcript_24454:777-1736(-)